MSTLLMRLKEALDYWIECNNLNIAFKYGYKGRCYKITIAIEERQIKEDEWIFDEEEL